MKKISRKNITRSKIVKVSQILFYKNGYSETGINTILKESHTFKKSFYLHFSSKEDLGLEYVKLIKNELITSMQKLLKKYSKLEEFNKMWIRLVRKKVSKHYFQGCPLANLPYSTQKLKKEIMLAFEELKKPLIDYFITNYKFPYSKAKNLSEEILFLYEGTLTCYKLDPKMKYFQYLEKYLKYILKEDAFSKDTNLKNIES